MKRTEARGRERASRAKATPKKTRARGLEIARVRPADRVARTKELAKIRARAAPEIIRAGAM